MPLNMTRLKAGEVSQLEDGGATEPEIPAHEGTADIIDTMEENLGTCDVKDESAAEVSALAQKAGRDNGGDDDAKAIVLPEVEKFGSEPLNGDGLADALDTTQQQQLRVKRLSGQRQKFIAAKLHKKNGIISGAVDMGTMSSCESAIDKDSSEILSEKANKTKESAELNVSVGKSPVKCCKVPVVNGFHSSVSMSTRRRSTLQECSQTMNLPASKLDTSINGTMVDTVTALLDRLSDSKDLKLVNGKELIVDGK